MINAMHFLNKLLKISKLIQFFGYKKTSEIYTQYLKQVCLSESWRIHAYTELRCQWVLSLSLPLILPSAVYDRFH